MNLIVKLAYFRVFRPPPLGALGVHCTITTCGSHFVSSVSSACECGAKQRLECHGLCGGSHQDLGPDLAAKLFLSVTVSVIRVWTTPQTAHNQMLQSPVEKHSDLIAGTAPLQSSLNLWLF